MKGSVPPMSSNAITPSPFPKQLTLIIVSFMLNESGERTENSWSALHPSASVIEAI